MEYTYDSWKALVGRLHQMQVTGTTSELRTSSQASGLTEVYSDESSLGAGENKTLAGILTLRGPDAFQAASNLNVDTTSKKLNRPLTVGGCCTVSFPS